MLLRGIQRRRLHQNYPGQRRARVLRLARRPSGRRRHLPRSSIPSIGPREHARSRSTRCWRAATAICEAAICYSGDILDPGPGPGQVRPGLLHQASPSELERRPAPTSSAIKDMAGLCKPVRRPASAGHGPEAGESACRSTSTPTTTSGMNGGQRCWRRPRPGSTSSMAPSRR